jgi:hypothetical protein
VRAAAVCCSHPARLSKAHLPVLIGIEPGQLFLHLGCTLSSLLLCLLQGGGQPGAAQPRASWALGGAVTLQQPGPPLPRHTADQRRGGERTWTAPWGLVVAAADRAVAWAWAALRCETCAWTAAGSVMSILQFRPIPRVGSISLGRLRPSHQSCCVLLHAVTSATSLPATDASTSPLVQPPAFHICSHQCLSTHH